MYSRKGWLKESAEIETSADGFLFLLLFISQGEEKVLFFTCTDNGIFELRDVFQCNKEQHHFAFLVFDRSKMEQNPHRCTWKKK